MNNFRKAMLTFAVATGQELTRGRLDALCGFLTGYDEADLLGALSQHARRSQWLPTPAELIQFVEGTTADRAADQWALAIKTFGGNAYRRDALDAATHKAIATIGGWQALGQTREQDLPFRRREFVAAYTARMALRPTESLSDGRSGQKQIRAREK